MKKQKLKNLELNKKQISNLRGGANTQAGTDTQVCNYTDTCPSIFDYTCYAGCESQVRECYSELASACGGCPTMDVGGCEVTIQTIDPSGSRVG